MQPGPLTSHQGHAAFGPKYDHHDDEQPEIAGPDDLCHADGLTKILGLQIPQAEQHHGAQGQQNARQLVLTVANGFAIYVFAHGLIEAPQGLGHEHVQFANVRGQQHGGQDILGVAFRGLFQSLLELYQITDIF